MQYLSILTILGHTKEREAHQKRAENFQNQLAKDSKKIHCFTFDLQQAQPLPFIRVNKEFYHRKTWLFNFGPNYTKHNQASMYIWTETTAARGSQEITSYLDKFLKEQVLKEDEIVDLPIAWSDSCGGQNRKFIMTCFFLRVLNENENVKSIIHRLPISGHSFLPNDRDFGDIEKSKSKKDAIYTVSQYEQLIKSSKTKSTNVKLMETQDFFYFMKSINFSNLHKPVDSEGEKFSWLEIHKFKYKEGLFGFKFRYNLTDEYRTCLLGKPSRKQGNAKPVFHDP